MAFLDQIDWTLILLACATLGLAPFVPEPHIWEKLKMLVAGDLVKPIDIFDLLMHGAPFLLLIAKILREVTKAA
ncbi:RND transporter [Salibaculum griseiflavum]|uniref:RND transporter n=1 Tax=Salibaculum griseiflavum TaxID=1914409 RepID=A0A2V1PAM2_9RHOB|nr:RND transporter [Salibaculum griseiflavum]PWG18132.1 RND transporter [Salibaculum griseiflavum]